MKVIRPVIVWVLRDMTSNPATLYRHTADMLLPFLLSLNSKPADTTTCFEVLALSEPQNKEDRLDLGMIKNNVALYCKLDSFSSQKIMKQNVVNKTI